MRDPVSEFPTYDTAVVQKHPSKIAFTREDDSCVTIKTGSNVISQHRTGGRALAILSDATAIHYQLLALFEAKYGNCRSGLIRFHGDTVVRVTTTAMINQVNQSIRLTRSTTSSGNSY
jgi:hypothetical protein